VKYTPGDIGYSIVLVLAALLIAVTELFIIVWLVKTFWEWLS
jgi:hypothetical protein